MSYITILLIVQGVKVEPANQQAPWHVHEGAQEGDEGLGGGVDKQQRAAIAQALKDKGFFAALEVSGEGAVGEPAAAVFLEDIDHATAKIPWAEAHGDLRAELYHLMGGANAEKAAALD